MRITGTGFQAHDGSTVVLYTSRGILDEVYGAGQAAISSGGFTFDFPSGYQRAQRQGISWFVDADHDGVCNTGAGDHVGFLIVGPFDPTPDERIDVTISDNHMPAVPAAADPCAGIAAPLHDFDVVGSGFDAHEGLTVHLMTSSPYNGRILGAGRATIAGGAFAFHFPKGFERTTYQDVYWYVDVDGDGACNTSADHTGYLSTAAFTPLDPSASVQQPISDNHAQVSVHGDVCIVMNGCRRPF